MFSLVFWVVVMLVVFWAGSCAIGLLWLRIDGGCCGFDFNSVVTFIS